MTLTNEIAARMDIRARRIKRGFEAIDLHPDPLTLEVAAADIIADIAHAVVASGGDAADLFERASFTYHGDGEDE